MEEDRESEVGRDKEGRERQRGRDGRKIAKL